MTLFETRHRFQFADGIPSSELDETATQILDALFDCHGVADPDMEAVLARGEVEITFGIEAQNVAEATVKAAAAIQSAIVSAGHITNFDWNAILEAAESSATKSDDRTLADA